jgi:p24 family protein alpha
MAPSRSTRDASWLYHLLIVGLLLSPVKALYFYMDGTAQKCFYEELPKDTLVVGNGQHVSDFLMDSFLTFLRIIQS